MSFSNPVKTEFAEELAQERAFCSRNDEIDELFNSALVENLDKNQQVIKYINPN